MFEAHTKKDLKIDTTDPAQAQVHHTQWGASPIAFYAEGIDRSDYVDAVAPKIRARIGHAQSLIDIGAGAGQLGAALCGPRSTWLALEPDSGMCARLEARQKPKPVVVNAGWEGLPGYSLEPQDMSLAANIAAPLTDARAFFQMLRPLTRRAMVWVVPAQHGPRGMCLAACLDPDWHGEDERPGYELTLDALGRSDAPSQILFADWTFQAQFPSLDGAVMHFVRALKWEADDPRVHSLRGRLTQQASSANGSVTLCAPKRSAILIWSLNS